MKRLLVHWVEMRTLEVPDNAPETTDEFEEWLWDNGYNREQFVVKADQRDFELVDVLDD
jgi:hypothetical protein